MSRVLKCRVRVPPGAAIGNRIKVLEQHRLVRALGILIVPHVVWVLLAGDFLVDSVGIDHGNRDEILVIHGTGIADSKRVSQDGLDGTPYL